MSKYQKKYITLSDASKISGYTAQELRNFCKIGLIPFKKQKNKLFVRFDAFEKINESNTSNHIKTNNQENTAVGQPTVTSLTPFTMPHPKMVRVLETVAFTAALAMTMHISAMPGVSSKVLQTVDLSGATVAYMADTMSDLLQTGVTVPLEIGAKVASIGTLSATETTLEQMYAPAVAGVSVNNEDLDLITTTSTEGNIVTNSLIKIADSAEDFNDLLNRMSVETYNLLVAPYQFENLDSGIQYFFRL